MEVKKNPKANLNGWSNIFFLSGLAFMLFISWQAMELDFNNNTSLSDQILNIDSELEEEIPITEVMNTPPPPPPPPQVNVQEVIAIVEDDLEIEETVIESTETDQNEAILDVEDVEDADIEEEEVVNIPFAVIEEVPIFPGCGELEGNEAKKKCMSDGVMKFVQDKFNTELASELGLEGRQRIAVQFKIDKNGDVVNVRARAPHPMLQAEAIKVVQSLPKMLPGKQRGRPVGVLYSLPILFKVESR